MGGSFLWGPFCGSHRLVGSSIMCHLRSSRSVAIRFINLYRYAKYGTIYTGESKLLLLIAMQ